MLIKLKDICDYTKNAPEHSERNYQIVVSAKDDYIDLASDVKALTQKLARLRQQQNDNLLWYVGLSNHESKGNTQKSVKRENKVGRPKVIISGQKTDEHFHIFLMSRCREENVQPEFKEIIKFLKKRNKKYGHLKQHKSSKVYGCGYIPYVYRQSEHIFKTPDFNFDYFINPLYDDSLNCNNYE